MAHIKYNCECPYICVADDSEKIISDTVENLMNHPAMISSNKDPNDPNLSAEQFEIIGKYIIVEGDPPENCEKIIFVEP